MPNRKRTLLASLVLTVAVFLAYGAVWRFDFVRYDDPSHVFDNAHIATGLSGENFRWAFTHFNAGQWLPLTWLSFMLDVSLFGLNPGAMHGVNVLLHATNVLLLFTLLRRMTGKFWHSFAVAALFALHPVNVESVAWITERKNVLSTMFWLLATLAYVRHAERPRAATMALVAVLLACGLMAKAMLVTLPCTLLLLDFWPIARWRTAKWPRLVAEKIPLFALSAVACWLQIRAASSDGLLWAAAGQPPGYGIFCAFANVARYLGLLVFPANLAPMYALPANTPVLLGSLGAAIIAAMLGVGLALRKSTPAVLVGTLWFLGVQVPVSGLVGTGDAVLCDRYLYVPGIGFFIAAVWGVSSLRVSVSPALLRSLAAAAAIAMCALTFAQTRHWRNSFVLFTHAAEVSPDSITAQKNARCALGTALARAGRHAEAIAEFRRILREHPGDAEALLCLGTQLLATGAAQESADTLSEAVAQNPADPAAREWLARARTAAGQ